MKLSYFGHSSFLLENSSVSILIDPFINGNPLAQGVEISSLKCDYILVTHAHSDHVGDTLEIAKNTGATVISNYEICQYLQSKGLEKCISMNFGGTIPLAFGEISYWQAQHSSSFEDGTYGGNPGSFVVSMDSRTLFFAGDTSLHSDLKLFGSLYSFDYAILPIGDIYTMGIEQAVLAAKFLKTKNTIACHYDTFPSIKIDIEGAVRKFATAKQKLIIIEPKSSIEI